MARHSHALASHTQIQDTQLQDSELKLEGTPERDGAAGRDAERLETQRPWAALWVLLIGFFMILLDTTIVTVALPSMQQALGASLTAVMWVTSAYLLAYAVPLLVAGRMGDRFGMKRMYLIGLVIFTLASLAGGLAPSIGVLIVARIIQGIGASIMTPQTLSIVTHIFPMQIRGQALAIWGASASVASLVGPLLGGVFTSTIGWEWIFFVNVPIGVIGFLLALKLVPEVRSGARSFDWLGVVLSGVALLLVVFAVQEGSDYNWGLITDSLTIGSWSTGIPISVWGLIIAGAVVLALFVAWQAVMKREPVVPLGLFKDRNFVLASVGMALMGGLILAQAFPVTIYLQQVRGMSAMMAALMTMPSAMVSAIGSPFVGKWMARVGAKWLAAVGFVMLMLGMLWMQLLMTADSQVSWILAAMVVFGIGNALTWGPLTMNATSNLPRKWIGAGSGVFNTIRQGGSVLGSAAVATLMGQLMATEQGPAAALAGSMWLAIAMAGAAAVLSVLMEKTAAPSWG